MGYTIFRGAILNPESLTSYQALQNALLAVRDDGTIDWLAHDVPDCLVQQTLLEKGCSANVDFIELKEGEFIIPGFIDTHTHAPQMLNIGSGQQYELLDWLANVTFPMESRFADPKFAHNSYRSVVRRIIDCGTTTCCYYPTLHLESSKILADIVHEYGMLFFINLKCNMDRESPRYYCEESPEASISATKDLISHISSLHDPKSEGPLPLVQPILTPRFAISCTPELLSKLGDLAASDSNLHIQTHISENKDEIAHTKLLFPNCTTYSDVYDTYGLLRSNTVLAHAVHLEPVEIELIKQRDAGISHCPTSNFNLSAGIAPIGEYLDRGIKVGLGTDVSGGFSPSIMNAIQHASIAAKVVAMQKPATNNLRNDRGFANRQLSIATLFYLATLGGAQVCNLDHNVGSLAPGKSFDALVVDVRKETDNMALWGVPAPPEPRDTLASQLERFLFCGDDRNIARVYVQGKLIGGKELHVRTWAHAHQSVSSVL
ncbi:guanine deaminase [Fistulina hepatica ATCC 64428]|nr:guanine deaminase [Fistulina hepatica ATCC 64428]